MVNYISFTYTSTFGVSMEVASENPPEIRTSTINLKELDSIIETSQYQLVFIL
jgi:hypothetical protein